MAWSRVVAVTELERQLQFSHDLSVRIFTLGGSRSSRGVPTKEVHCALVRYLSPHFSFFTEIFFLHYLLKMTNCNFSLLFQGFQ